MSPFQAGHGLLPVQADIAVGDVHALLPVAIGQGVVKGIGGHGLPLARLVFHVAGALFIAADLTQIVEQSHDGDGLVAVLQAIELLHPLPLEIVHQAVVHVQAVVAQAALIGPVIPGRRRGR